MATASASSEARIEAEVTGRVQGVGFRHFTRRTARQLDLTGWVRNEPDGSVTVIAEGPRDRLEELVENLEDGPRRARVDGLDVDWRDPRDEFGSFEVRFH